MKTKLLSTGNKYSNLNYCKIIMLFSTSLLLMIIGHACDHKLEIKPDQSLSVPSTLEDFQSLLNNSNIMNATFPEHTEAGTDNYYLTSAAWGAANINVQNTYLWNEEIYPGQNVTSWNNPYRAIFYSNCVLEGLESRKGTIETKTLDEVIGSALFHRAFNYFALTQLFCNTYDESTAVTEMGLPLRLHTDININPGISSVKDVYERVIGDLKKAIDLLPDISPYKTRPGRTAAYAMLSRVYLSMGWYNEALANAENALKLYKELIDYNLLNQQAPNPVQMYNKEVIFHSQFSSTGFFSTGGYSVDTVLYRSYHENDLRRTIFFNKQPNGLIPFKGSYTGSSTTMFGGLAVDELLLTKAECNARLGSTNDAIAALNSLLIKRYKQGTYIPIAISDRDELLRTILEERRKELVFRGSRWSDLRRLNMDPRFAVILQRNINGKVVTLNPGSARYIYPWPDNEIDNNPALKFQKTSSTAVNINEEAYDEKR